MTSHSDSLSLKICPLILKLNGRSRIVDDLCRRGMSAAFRVGAGYAALQGILAGC